LPGGVAKFAPLPRARLATLLGENA
jgi:hypothetical protein